MATTVLLALGGLHPIDIEGGAVQDYHRPLNGEGASLTVTLPPTAVDFDWLCAPPLGLDCRVTYGGELIMIGVLYGVEVTVAAVKLRIEG